MLARLRILHASIASLIQTVDNLLLVIYTLLMLVAKTPVCSNHQSRALCTSHLGIITITLCLLSLNQICHCIPLNFVILSSFIIYPIKSHLISIDPRQSIYTPRGKGRPHNVERVSEFLHIKLRDIISIFPVTSLISFSFCIIIVY